MVKTHVSGNLNVAIFKEGKMYVAFAPALDLVAQGKSITEARKNFGEVFDIYFEETLHMGTLEKDLLRCGWQKRENTIYPPAINEFPPHEFGRDIELRALSIMPLSEKKLTCPA